MSVRLVTFNVQHGTRPDGTVDPALLARAVAGLGGDVVALQEVDRGQQRSGEADLARMVADAVGASEYRFVPTVAGTVDPRRAMPGEAPKDPAAVLAPAVASRGRARWAASARVLRSPAGRAAVRAYLGTWRSRRRARGDEPDAVPGYGIALVSRLPVREWWHVRLPLGSPWPFGRLQLGRDEPRAALAAVVETPGGPLTVVTTHLTTGRRWNRRQLRWLVRRLRTAPRPLVLLGDFNIRGDEPAARTGWHELVHVPTYPRHRPFLRIDHVLADGIAAPDGVAAPDAREPGPVDPGPVDPEGVDPDRVEPAARYAVRALGPARAVDAGISDHCAVVVDLEVVRARR
ncbi:hypothetical protein ET495_13225 [Xylanimonas allomyrinae]|uniref:Endonuclease/exonuclease/phosphatase domain-containing protein n=1 Tax=Xylanimonas allomyrinae TaxID=2509459 RepID=A0A4P6ENF7_9MICO|nr:endonuclease/exonuclease/phosphatase family protein [Xylanimonas allomyrinae]QAY64025.1 hypothetical protein ET495_13225 [Xylanimonas allomyrinae]